MPVSLSPAAEHRRLRRWAPWIAAAVACAVFLNALANGYAFDDVTVVAQNPLVHGLAHWRDIWVSDYWPNLPYQVGLYRPLTIALYAVEWTLWHGNALGFHLANVLLHGVVSALVVLLLFRLGASLPAAMAGGVVFAIDPLHVEVVAGVVGAAELLMTLLVLLACLLHLRRNGSRLTRWVGVSACFLAALLVKESAVALPLLLIVVDGLDPRREAPLRRVVWDDAPLYLLMAAVFGGYLGLRFAVLGVFAGSTVAPALQGLTASRRVATAISIWPDYLRLLAYPRDLSASYDPNVRVAAGWTSRRVWFGLALGVAAVWTAVKARRRVPWWTAAVAWFAASMFVVSNLIVPVGVVLAERTLYLPSVGLALAVVPLADLIRPHRRLVAVAAVVAALAVVRTWTRTPVWRSTHTLLAQLAATHPESFVAQSYLGDQALGAGNPKLAVQHYAVAWGVMHDPHIGTRYAYALTRLKDWALAEQVARTACKPMVPQPCLYLIDALLAEGRPSEARAALDSLAERAPPSPAIAERAAAVARAMADSAARQTVERTRGGTPAVRH
ncbi:MAG TPA: hypothetical protein VF737_00460 [Gemmatimonadaceae bacterium]